MITNVLAARDSKGDVLQDTMRIGIIKVLPAYVTTVAPAQIDSDPPKDCWKLTLTQTGAGVLQICDKSGVAFFTLTIGEPYVIRATPDAMKTYYIKGAISTIDVVFEG